MRLLRGSSSQPFLRLPGALSALMLLCPMLLLGGCTALFNKPFEATPFYAAKDNPRAGPGILYPGIKEAGLHSAADVKGYYASTAQCLRDWVVTSNPFDVVPEITVDSVYPEPSLREYVTAAPLWGDPLLLTDHYYFVSHTAPGAAIFVVELRQLAPDLVHADIYAGPRFTRTPESIAATVVEGLKHCEGESGIAGATTPSIGPAPQDSDPITGIYDVRGVTSDGRNYTGVARAIHIGDKIYEFEWNEDGNTIYRYGVLDNGSIDMFSNEQSYEFVVHPDGTIAANAGANGKGSTVFTPRTETD